MPCTPTSSAFYRTEFGQGGCPDTLVLLCLRVWYRSTQHSVIVWLLGSLGGKHTPVSVKGSHAVGVCVVVGGHSAQGRRE